jgi:hypothetical protein
MCSLSLLTGDSEEDEPVKKRAENQHRDPHVPEYPQGFVQGTF